MSAVASTALDPIYFFNNAKVGAPPARATKTISFVGKVKKAILHVNFFGKFGWELQTVQFNNAEFTSKKHRKYNSNPNIIEADITSAVVNGDNSLTVHYSAPFTTFTGDNTTLTAYVTVLVEPPKLQDISKDIQKIITQPISTLPSLNLIAQTAEQKAADATIPTLATLAIIAAIVIGVAAVAVKVIR